MYNAKLNKKEQATINTVNNLINISRQKFSTKGYLQTSLEEIVEEMNMTRGAFYHHFKNKEKLFIAVLNKIQEEIAENIEKKSETTDDLWQQLVLGCIAFVETAILDCNKRILLIDAPSVVGWEKWREIDSKNSLKLLEEQLNILKENKLLKDINIQITARLISGALNELALYLAVNSYIKRSEIEKSIIKMLEGFKNNG